MSDVRRPPSVSNIWINFVGGLCFFLFLYMGNAFGIEDVATLSIASALAAFLTISTLEVIVLKVHRRPSVGLLEKPGPWSADRLMVKMIGYVLTIFALWFVYRSVPEYGQKSYDLFHVAFATAFPLLVMFGAVYIVSFDRYMKEPKDNLYHFGAFFLLRWKDSDSSKVESYFKSVCLRGYFIPFMAVLFLTNVQFLLDGPASYINNYGELPEDFTSIEFLRAILTGYFFFALVDMLYGVLGYVAAFRPLDTHFRSTDRSIAGWASCLVCYPPFFDLLMLPVLLSALFANPEWFVWLADYPVLLGIWGCLVVLFMCAESCGSFVFGTRFSNLTYRGLITGGPYRYTKHPQYIAKMFNRFAVYMPFLSLYGWVGVLAGLSSFSCLVLIYYFRARTEENYLSMYPEYVEYAQWINENGVFKWLAKILPFLKFNEEKARAGRWF